MSVCQSDTYLSKDSATRGVSTTLMAPFTSTIAVVLVWANGCSSVQSSVVVSSSVFSMALLSRGVYGVLWNKRQTIMPHTRCYVSIYSAVLLGIRELPLTGYVFNWRIKKYLLFSPISWTPLSCSELAERPCFVTWTKCTHTVLIS